MAVNALIAQGIRSIGADLPEVGNLLNQKRQMDTRNALAQQGMDMDQQRNDAYMRQVGVQEQAQRNTMETAQREQIRAQAGAVLDNLQSIAGTPQYGAAVQRLQASPQVAEAARKLGFDVSELGDPTYLPVARGIVGMAAAPVPFEKSDEAKKVLLAAEKDRELEDRRSGNTRSEIVARGEQDRMTAGVTSPAKVNSQAQGLRKEFEGLQSVQNYRAVEPLLKSAQNAPDNGYGDLDIIYAVGKILDPGSVVREGELKLTIDAGSPLQKVLGATRFNFEKGGRLTPQQRQQVMGMLKGRAGAIKESFDRETKRFSNYATQSNIDPSMVVGAVGEPTPTAQPQFNYVPGQGLVPAQ